MNRYRQLAELFKTQIQQNTWRAGEKLPSVRVTSRNHSVSAGTVLQAYQLLEAQGWVAAKPQSGYFVTAELDRLEPSPPATSVYRSNINDELYDYLKNQASPDAMKFGSAFPDPALFPLDALNRNLASSGRKMGPETLLDNLPPGSESLRRLIAQRYIQQGMVLTHDDIVITSGALEALNLSLQAVTQPGDTIVVESPTFYGALQAIERLGLKAIEISVDPRTGHSLQQIEAAFTGHDVRACWLMTNFHNPTGTSLNDEQKQRIVELADKHDVYLIEDDVYSELYFLTRNQVRLKLLIPKIACCIADHFQKVFARVIGWGGWSTSALMNICKNCNLSRLCQVVRLSNKVSRIICKMTAMIITLENFERILSSDNPRSLN